MAEVTYVLLDSRANLVADTWAAGPWCTPIGACNWSCHFYTLQGGPGRGLLVLDVTAPEVALRLLPGRGLGIWQAYLSGLRLGWDSPAAGPVNPALVESHARGGLGWLAGFDEWLVRCGLEWNGAPGVDRMTDNQGNVTEMFLPLHGNVAGLPAQHLQVTIRDRPRPSILVSSELTEAHLFGPGFRLRSDLMIALDSPWFQLRDRVTNTRSAPGEFELLYHLNFGPPLLGEGAVLEAPYKVAAPRDAEAARGMRRFNRFGPPTPGWREQCFYLELAGRGRKKEASVLLVGPKADTAVEVTIGTGSLPCFSLWKNTGALADGYVVGLEPATNYPNQRGFEREQGRVRSIRPNETWTGELDFRLRRGRTAVTKARAAIRKAAPGGVIARKPLPRFSPPEA
jgi:hypothetical protein